MKVQVGDRIVVESEMVARARRAGIVEAVLQDDPARVQVRWEDGHTSILSPVDGAARVEPAEAAARRP